MRANSNLDCDEHHDGPTCPCLPPIWTIRIDDRRVGLRAFHDANVARVLRAEGGHP